jgi:Matrixin
VKILTFLIFVLVVPGIGFADASQPNWDGRYAPCNRHLDLLNPEHVDLGVRVSTSNTVLVRQFAKAMDFWTAVLDLQWHEVDSEECSIQLVDGTPALFDWCTCMSARSQFPDRSGFQGWIAFNPRSKLTKQEMFLDSVHEIGHLLGLPHNPNDLSVMYAFELDKSASLDAADLDALAARHRLRASLVSERGSMAHIRVVAPR